MSELKAMMEGMRVEFEKKFFIPEYEKIHFAANGKYQEYKHNENYQGFWSGWMAKREQDKEILECLMDMCSQYLAKGPDSDEWLEHSFMSAGENALDLLKRFGLAISKDDVTYRLSPHKLKDL